ncbi:MAG: hypothetical protein ACOCQB_03365 [Halanaerobiaceae bacterium]
MLNLKQAVANAEKWAKKVGEMQCRRSKKSNFDCGQGKDYL